MDRDAPPPAAPPPGVVPPVAAETARATGLAGVGLVAAAAGVGLAAAVLPEGGPGVLGTVRLVLVFAGAVTAGVGVSLRADRWQSWAVGAAAAGLAYFGTPAHWDSFRLLFAVLAAVAAGRAVLALLPAVWRRGVISAVIVFHFGGIFLATVSPPPTPWFVEQVYHRVYGEYLQFVYLRNAYHFYSPEPGPASVLCALIQTELPGETETDAAGLVKQKYKKEWVVLPRRPADVRDPLGVTYYRRLSLTDQISRGMPDTNTATFEKSEVQLRRNQAAVQYPSNPNEPGYLQYRLPTPEVSRFLLPSYAQHLIIDRTPGEDAAGRTTVKIYRMEHRTLGVGEFTGVGTPDGRPVDPYAPTTYRPYFLGEFDAHGTLVDPKDAMLYWLLPIIPRPPGGAAGGEPAKPFDDYMSKHAGYEFDWRQLR